MADVALGHSPEPFATCNETHNASRAEASACKMALGLFHFNPHWGGQLRSRHRHCTEALAPFLRALKRHPGWRVNLEISGSGLEFLQDYYPALVASLRELVSAGQVELISSLYTPALWIAFPRRDLIESILRNRDCLMKLGFKPTRIFFSQEAFFGEVVSTLSDYFDIFICKDDYLNHFFSIDYSNPCFAVGGKQVIVASGHLLYESSLLAHAEPQLAPALGLTERHRLYIEHSSELNNGRNFPARNGRFGSVEWHWYHCGDGNHFGTIYKPQDLERSYNDPAWERWCEAVSAIMNIAVFGFLLFRSLRRGSTLHIAGNCRFSSRARGTQRPRKGFTPGWVTARGPRPARTGC